MKHKSTLLRQPAQRWLLPCLLLLNLISFATNAHESRPAYIEILEGGAGVININWTRPVSNARALNIHPVFPVTCSAKGSINKFQLQGLMHEKWALDCGESELSGKQLSISGLDNSISDVLLRFQSQHGRAHVKVLNSQDPVFIFPSESTPLTNVTAYYFKLGVLHILSGSDHLLFIFGLLLLINKFWSLIKTITAFTLAHSLSLVAATLGYVHVASTPVEAVIALSIMFLACELVRKNEHSLSRRLPWLIAAIFGLVHGLGFAGALSEIGLPDGDIPLALFMFNVGVETGQILFIIVATGLLQLLRKFVLDWSGKVELPGSYIMGSIAAFWLVERVAGFY